MNHRPFDSYKDSGVPWLGQIPTQWEVKRSRRLFSQRRERAQASDQQLTASQKYGIIPQKEFVHLEGQKVVEVLQDFDILKRVYPGDFVISMRSFQGGLEWSAFQGSMSSAYVALVPSSDIHPGYFRFVFKSPPYIQALQSTTNLVRDGQALRYGNFILVDLPSPPFNEQAAIATFLDQETAKIDALVAEQQRLIALLAEKRKAVISHAVTKGLDPDASMKDSGVEWLGELPAHWSLNLVKYLGKLGNGATPSRDNFAYWEGGYFPWLTSSVVNQEAVVDAEEFVTDCALKECSLPIIEPPAVLVGITGQGRTRGMATTLLISATINQHIAYIKPDQSIIDISFLRRVLDNSYFFLRTESEGAGATKGAITCNQIANLILPFPPRAEQIAIAIHIDRETAKIDSLAAEANRAIELLQERRTALISAAVTGKIDVSSEQREVTIGKMDSRVLA